MRKHSISRMTLLQALILAAALLARGSEPQWKHLSSAGVAGKKGFQYPEGLAAADIDGDGRLDLPAGNIWLKYRSIGKFDAFKIGSIGGRIATGKFKPGKYPQSSSRRETEPDRCVCRNVSATPR